MIINYKHLALFCLILFILSGLTYCGNGLTTLLPDNRDNYNIQPELKPGITIGPVSGIPTEAGGTASFSLVLNSKPSATVTILVSSSVPGTGIPASDRLTFTPADWNIVQFITVIGMDETDYNDDRYFEIYFPDIISDDLAYASLILNSLSFTTKSRGTPGVSIAYNTALKTSESGDTASFDILLDTKPLSNVTITVQPDDKGYGISSPSSLIFTPEIGRASCRERV